MSGKEEAERYAIGSRASATIKNEVGDKPDEVLQIMERMKMRISGDLAKNIFDTVHFSGEVYDNPSMDGKDLVVDGKLYAFTEEQLKQLIEDSGGKW